MSLTSLPFPNLDLRNTPVSDVAPLAALTGLQNLDLRNTPVSDVAPLAALTVLQVLDLRNTQVSDVAPLAALTGLQHLGLPRAPCPWPRRPDASSSPMALTSVTLSVKPVSAASGEN